MIEHDSRCPNCEMPLEDTELCVYCHWARIPQDKKSRGRKLMLMDKRLVDIHIKMGKISREEHNKYLENLEDCSELFEETETQMIIHIEEDIPICDGTQEKKTTQA